MLQKSDHTNNSVVSVFPHTQKLHLMYSRETWVLVFLGAPVRSNNTRPRLPSSLSFRFLWLWYLTPSLLDIRPKETRTCISLIYMYISSSRRLMNDWSTVKVWLLSEKMSWYKLYPPESSLCQQNLRWLESSSFSSVQH